MKKAYIFLANGFEEIEALATVDILRRAGITATTVSITSCLQVTGAHNIEVAADITIDKVEKCNNEDWLILPGGMPGATNLASCETLCRMLRSHNEQNGYIAAICASPAVVLAPLGILDKKEATCYPGFEEALKDCKAKTDAVVVYDNIITANGPGNTIAFALTIIKKALNEKSSRETAEGLLVSPL